MPDNFYQIPEIILSYKNTPTLSHRPKITQSKDAYEVLLNAWDDDKIGFVEQAKVLLLNQNNRVLGIYEFSTGGVAGTICDPKLVFAAALKANASNLILAHNHPSEHLEPSRSDKVLTDKMKQAGEYLEMHVLDHLIISPHAYYSFSEDKIYKKEDVNIRVVKTNKIKPPANAPAAEAIDLLSVQTVSVENKELLKDIAGHALTRSETSYRLLMHVWEENKLDVQLSFKMLCLDKNCCVINLHQFPQDRPLATQLDAQFLMALATRDKASHIVLAQNKPLGVILPNITDLDFTNSLTRAGNDHDIPLLDYLFINQNGYYSYNDNEFKLGYNLQPL